MDGLIWFLTWRFLSTGDKLCYKEIHVSTKIRVLPSGTLSQTQDLENFASAYIDRREVYQFSSRKVDAQSVINWTVVGQQLR